MAACWPWRPVVNRQIVGDTRISRRHRQETVALWSACFYHGAQGGTRTPITLRWAVFETAASAIPPPGQTSWALAECLDRRVVVGLVRDLGYELAVQHRAIGVEHDDRSGEQSFELAVDHRHAVILAE